MKRILSFVLCLSMLFSMLPVNVFASDVEEPVITETTPVTEAPQEPETEAPTQAPVIETAPTTEPAAEETIEVTEAVPETTAAPEATEPEETAAEETVPEETEAEEITWEYTYFPEIDLPSNEELFAAYAEQKLYGMEIATFGTAAGERLTGDEKLAYDALVPVIKDIANGKRASTEVSVGYNGEIPVTFSGSGSDFNINALLNALLSDLPYDLYWFNKTGVPAQGMGAIYVSFSSSGSRLRLTFSFMAAANYSSTGAEGTFEVSTSKTGATTTAVNKAKSIVEKYASKSDYEKLLGYKDEICALVSYNTTAANSGNFSKNDDPWQLIYVFDGLESTKVVCEGYAKAFQYLCDLSDFSGDVACYNVSGVMAGGTGAGAHMWNIVTIGSQNYLVDVTNSDAGTIGASGSLFLAGKTPNSDGSYTIGGVKFVYNDETKNLWGTGEGSILNLAAENYDPTSEAPVTGPMTGEELLAALEGVSGPYDLKSHVTISSPITLPSGVYLQLTSDAASITVTTGGSLTVSQFLGVATGGTVTVEEGASLILNGTLSVGGGGSVDVYGTLEHNAKIECAGVVTVYGGYIAGDSGYVQLIGNGAVLFTPLDRFLHDVATADNLTVWDEIILEEDLTISMNGQLSFADFARLVVPSGVTLTLNCPTMINGAELIVEEGGKLISNVDLTINDPQGNGGKAIINGDFENNGSFWVNTGSFADFNGYAISNGPIFVGFGGNSRLSINGQLDTTAYLCVDEPGSLNLAPGAKLNLLGADGYLDNAGYCYLGGDVYIEGLMSSGARRDEETGEAVGAEATIEIRGCVTGSDTSFIAVGEGGSIACYGPLTTAGEVVVEPNGAFWVDSTVTLSGPGPLTVDGWLHIDFFDEFAEANGQLNLETTANVNGYLHVADGGVLNVTDKAVLNILNNENGCGYLDNQGHVGMFGTMNLDGLFTTGAAQDENGNVMGVPADAEIRGTVSGSETSLIGVLTDGNVTCYGPVTTAGEVTIEERGTLWVDDTVTINGSVPMTNFGNVHVNHFDDFSNKTGVLNLNSEVTNYGYLAVHPNGTLNINGTLLNEYTNGTEDAPGYCAYIDNQGLMNISGTVTSYGLLSTGGNGSESSRIVVENGGVLSIAVRNNEPTASSLDILEGGGLEGNGTVKMDGYMSVFAPIFFQGSFKLGRNAYVNNIPDEYGNPHYISCIPTKDQAVTYEGTDLYQIRQTLSLAEQGYRVVILITEDMELGSLVIPGNAEVSIGADVTIPEGADIANYGSIYIWGNDAERPGSLTINGGLSNYHTGGFLSIWAGGTMTVNGTVHNGTSTFVMGNLVINGNWKGYAPEAFDDGTISGDGIPNPQKSFEKLLAEAAAGGYPAVLNESLELTGDVTVNCQLIIEEGVTLTVPSGVTLTNNGWLDVQGGTLDVQSGGMLVNNATISSIGGSVKVASDAYNAGADSIVMNSCLNGNISNIQGIPTKNQRLYMIAQTEDDIQIALDLYVIKGFGDVSIQVTEALELNNNVTLPDGAVLVADGSLTVNGSLTVEKGASVMMQPGTVLTLNGMETINRGTIDIFGTLTQNNWNVLVNECGSINVAGTYDSGSEGSVFNEVIGGVIGTVAGVPEDRMYLHNSGTSMDDVLLMLDTFRQGGYIDATVQIGDDFVIDQDLTIPEGAGIMVITFEPGDSAALTIEEGVTVTNHGTISVYKGNELIVDGALNISGTVTVEEDAAMTVNGSVNVTGMLVAMGKVSVNGSPILVADESCIETVPGQFINIAISGTALESFTVGVDKTVASRGTDVNLWIENWAPSNAAAYEYRYNIVGGNGYFYTDEISEEGYPIVSSSITASRTDTVTFFSNSNEDITVEIKAITGYDNYGSEIYAENLTQTVTVKMAQFGTAISYSAYDFFEGNFFGLYGGRSINMGAFLTNFENGAYLGDAVYEWIISGEGAQYVTTSEKNGILTVKVSADLDREVELRVTANPVETPDGIAASGFTLPVTLRPKVNKVDVTINGQVQTGKTISFDLNRTYTGADGAEFKQRNLELDLISDPAAAYSETAYLPGANFEEKIPLVTWASSNKNVATVDEHGNVSFTGIPGTVKITATAQMGGKKTASVTIKAVELTQSIAPAANTVTELIGGKSATYTVTDDNGTVMKSSAVTWFLCDENGSAIESHPYASINAKGKLTTKVVADETQVYLMAKVIGDDQTAQLAEPVEVTLYPAVTSIEIVDPFGQQVNNWTMLWDYEDMNDFGPYQLTYAAAPSMDAVKSIQWKSSKPAIADISEDGLITAKGNGTVKFTLTATALDGKKVTASVTFKFGTYTKELDMYANLPNGDRQYLEIGVDDNLVIYSGESITFEAYPIPENPTTPGVNWSLTYTADKSYASISAKGVLKAKTVSNPQTIYVSVESKDGYCGYTIDVTILPKPVKVGSETKDALVIWEEYGDYLTKTTKTIMPGTEMYLVANDMVTWSSKTNAVEIDPDTGHLVAVKAGTTTITATAEDGRKATFTLKVGKLSSDVQITTKKGDAFTVASGKSLDLVGTVIYSDGSTDKKVTWSVSDPSLAKISSSGKLTATKNLTEPTVVTVYADAKDGNWYGWVDVEILPLSTGVEIYGVIGAHNVDVSNTTQKWDMTTQGSSFYLYAGVFPYNSMQDVTWKSSSTKVVTIDANGKVTCLKPGTVTITATAKDGSGKKASFKLTVTRTMAYLKLPQSAFIGGGKSLTMTKLDGFDLDNAAANKTLVWTMTKLDGNAVPKSVATLSNKGVLKTKAVKAPVEILVRAASTDGSGLIAECAVTIFPVTKGITLYGLNGHTGELTNVTGKTVDAPINEGYCILTDTTNVAGFDYNDDKTADEYLPNGSAWEISQSPKLRIEYDGQSINFYPTAEARVGDSVKVTLKALDGSGKSASFTIKLT